MNCIESYSYSEAKLKKKGIKDKDSITSNRIIEV